MITVDQIRSLSRPVKVLMATNAVSAFGGGLVLPFLWIYLTDIRHLGRWAPAATLAIQALTAVAGSLVWGVVVDRMPQRVVAPLVMTVAGVGTGMYALVTSKPTAIAAAIIYGLGISGVGTALRVMYGATAEKSQREMVFSLDYSILNVMMGLGVLAGGAVAVAHIGARADRYSLLFLIDGLTFLLTAVACAVLLPGTRVAPHGSGERAHGGYLAVLRNRQMLIMLAVMLVLMTVSVGEYKSGLPGYLTATGAVGAGGISCAFALNIVVIVIVQFMVLPRLERYRRSLILAASGLLFAACWAILYTASTQSGLKAVIVACIAMVFLSTGEALVVPVLTALLNNTVTDELRGRANALLSMAISTSSVLGPVIAGAALPWHRGTGFVIGMIAGSVGGAVLILTIRPLMHDESADIATTDATTSV
jgi:MFS family permease